MTSNLQNQEVKTCRKTIQQRLDMCRNILACDKRCPSKKKSLRYYSTYLSIYKALERSDAPVNMEVSATTKFFLPNT